MIILAQGSDRYGAHFSRWIADYLYFSTKKNEVYISNKFKYLNNLFFQPFKEICKYTDQPPPKRLHPKNKYAYVGQNLKVVKLIKSDIPSYFRETILKNFHKVLKGKINPKKNICVHLRLDDCAYYIPKYNNLKLKGDSVVRHINSDFTTELDMRKLEKKLPWIQQHNCNLENLYQFIKTVQQKYKNLEVDIVCSPVPKNYDFPKKFNEFNIFRHDSVDESILHMINSKVLILSASTIAYAAGLMHAGEQVYYPFWNHYFSYGLGSKLDKSHWKLYNPHKSS